MRRHKKGDQSPRRGFDYLKKVDAPRLRLMGAITLAWNWIEWTIDVALAVSLETHPDMWLELTSRINGMEGKVELLKKTLALSGYPPLPDGADPLVRKFLGAVGSYKKLRDGLIHARLTEPKAIIAETVQRRGVTDEMLVSREALKQLYDHLSLLGREAEYALQVYFFSVGASQRNGTKRKRLQDAERLLQALVQLRLHLQTREALLPLPEFPDAPQAPLDLGGAEAPAD